MPPLEALPTPVEEVLRRGVQSLTSFTSSLLPALLVRLRRPGAGAAPAARQAIANFAAAL